MPPAEVIAELSKHLLDDPDGKIAKLGKQLRLPQLAPTVALLSGGVRVHLLRCRIP